MSSIIDALPKRCSCGDKITVTPETCIEHWIDGHNVIDSEFGTIRAWKHASRSVTMCSTCVNDSEFRKNAYGDVVAILKKRNLVVVQV